MIINILESQDQFTFKMIINRLLKEYRKIIRDKSDEMKMVLLTNQANKTGKEGKSGNKAKDKTIKKCFIYSKPEHNEEEY